MTVALEIAVRYLKAAHRAFAGFVTWISLLGLFLGVMVLTVVVSVMNGFDAELKSRLLTAIPHIVVEDTDVSPKELVSTLPAEDANRVAQAFRQFEGVAMVSRRGAVNPVTVLGVQRDGLAAMPDVLASLGDSGQTLLEGWGGELLLGDRLAAHLGAAVGEEVMLVFAQPRGQSVAPVLERLPLGGTFDIGAELDVNLVIVPLASIPAVVRETGGTEGVQLRLTDPLQAPRVAASLRASSEYKVASWMERYSTLLNAVRLEKSMMFVILLLVVAVAAFNIVSGQVMVVRKKTADIAILRTMGANAGTITLAFLLQGALVAGVGIASGLVMGVIATEHINGIVAVLERWLSLRFLEGTYFVEIPSLILASDLLLIGGLSFVICLGAAYWPAHRAGQLPPAEGLH